MTISGVILCFLLILSVTSQSGPRFATPLYFAHAKSEFDVLGTTKNNSSAISNSSATKYISPIKLTLNGSAKQPVLPSERKISLQKSLERIDRRGPPMQKANVTVNGPTPGTETSMKPIANLSVQKTAFDVISNEDLRLFSLHNNILAPNRDIIDEPAVANRGGLTFFTGNFYAARSLNGGSSWTYIDPFQDMHDFLGDQDVVYDPSNQIFAWIRMSNVTQEGNNIFRLGISHDTINWFFYDLIPASFNNTWSAWDYPQLALSSHYLYITSDIYGPPASSCTPSPSVDCTFKGTLISRADLNRLSAGATTSFRFFADTSGLLHVFTPVQGATSTMYWATHLSNNEMRIYRWAESSLLVNSFDRHVPAWTDLVDGDVMSCPGPDHNNWCARSDSRITSGWVKDGIVGFLWNVISGNGFRYPYIDAATFGVNSMAYIGRPYLWSQSHAWMYGDSSPNQQGLGLSAFYGGGRFYPSLGAAAEYTTSGNPANWHMQNIMSGTSGPAPNAETGESGWGDFVRVKPYSGAGPLWIASGFTLEGGSTAEFIIPFVFVFGFGGGSGGSLSDPPYR
jgi:hypothetical protein